MSEDWNMTNNLTGTTQFQQSISFIYFLHFCELAIHTESMKIELDVL